MRIPALLLALSIVAAGCPSSEPDPGPVSVTVRDAYGPVAGANVVFQAPDWSVLAHVLTDAQGTASATVAAGTVVTVAHPGLLWANYGLLTVVGVEPGDALVLGEPATVGETQDGSAAVTYPGTFAGADQYAVTLGCTASGWAYAPDPVDVQISSTCDSSVDAIAIAISASSGMIAWSSATGVPVLGPPPSRTATVTLGAWRSDLGSMPVTLTNPPATATSASAYLSPRRNARRYTLASTAAGAPLSPPSGETISLPYARDFWTSARLEVAASFSYGDDVARYLENEAPLAPRTLDLSTALPPRLSGLTLVESEAGRAAGWSRAGSDAGLDATVLWVQWVDTDDRHRWQVLMPPGRSAFTFPELPVSLAAFLPDAGTSPSYGLADYDISTSSSYREFRASALGLLYDLPEAGVWTLRTSSTHSVP